VEAKAVTVRILQGDARTVLRSLPAASLHCCVTSPPYFNLRSYLPDDHSQKASEIGIEATPNEYVEALVDVFRALRPALRDDASVWLNLGDSYAAGGRGGGGSYMSERGDKSWRGKGATVGWRSPPRGLKPKDLIGIPWLVAFALQADGWWLRADCIWEKTNPQPESVTDRPARSHEYVFLLSKSESYFYDAFAVLEPASTTSRPRTSGMDRRAALRGDAPLARETEPSVTDQRNLRTVWRIATQPTHEEHYAAFPRDLARRAILAGTSELGCCSNCGAQRRRVVEKVRLRDGAPCDDLPAAKTTDKAAPTTAQGVSHNRIVTSRRTVGWEAGCDCQAELAPCHVIDPFGGSGTVGMVATDLGRHATLVELNPAYVEIAERRCAQTSLFAQEGSAAG
jgi:DNA modification methylase